MQNSGGGRLAARRSAAKAANSGKRRSSYHFGLRLALTEKPTKVRFVRSRNEEGKLIRFADPENPEIKYPWKFGYNYFIKTKDRPRGFTVEWTAENNLIDAYVNPAKYGLQDREELAAGAFLKKFPPKQYFCASGFIEESYHLVDRKREDGSGTFTDRVRCEGRNCPHCEEQWPKVFGNRFWIDFSPYQWMGPIDRVLEEMERHPKEGGYVYPSHYSCEGCGETLEFIDPKSKKEVSLDITNACEMCGATGDDILLDPNENVARCDSCDHEWSLLSHEDGVLKKYLDQELECNNCGHVGYPQPNFLHMFEDYDPEDEDTHPLEDWTPTTLFDARLVMYREAAQGERKGPLRIKNWTIDKPNPKLFDLRSQGWNGKEGHPSQKIAQMWVDRHKQTLNLDDIHPVLDPDEVAELLGLPNILAPNAQNKRKQFKPRTGRINK